MGPARRGRAAGRCRRDAATWPAPATEVPRLRSGLALPSPADSAARCVRAMPAAGINGDACPFPRTGENLSRAEGILRVRLSETRDSDARASRLTPNVASARCSLLTRLFSGLRQRMGIASTARARFVTATAGITANGFIC
jgi:hypothetical protein